MLENYRSNSRERGCEPSQLDMLGVGLRSNSCQGWGTSEKKLERLSRDSTVVDLIK